jgi:hypothetical protein
MNKTVIPFFEGKTIAERNRQLFKFLLENKTLLMTERKMYPKFADAVSYTAPVFDERTKTHKAAVEISADLLTKEVIQARLAINTTNLLDSHKDVHIPGIWKRTLKNNAKKMLHLQEHTMSFKGIIADGALGDVKAFVELMKWKELGFDYKGETETLLFDSTIRKARNSEMFDNYAKGYVTNHSVGMRYVDFKMCINSEERWYAEEKENWEQYFPMIVNQEDAEQSGYFWAVLEAQAFEGSAVPRGSNCATPTIEMKNEPELHSSFDQGDSGNHSSKGIDYDYLAKNFKL